MPFSLFVGGPINPPQEGYSIRQGESANSQSDHPAVSGQGDLHVQARMSLSYTYILLHLWKIARKEYSGLNG